MNSGKNSSNVYERLWKQEASIKDLVLKGKRDPEAVANIFQAIISGSVYSSFENSSKLESKPDRSWREDNSVIYFTVTSDGTSGIEWIARLKKKGFRLNYDTEELLVSSDFRFTNREKVVVAVLKSHLLKYRGKTTDEARKFARVRGFTTPNAEVACLIREKFSDPEIEAMGLHWILTMHQPIKKTGHPHLLAVRTDDAGNWLYDFNDLHSSGYDKGLTTGFAFIVS